MAPREDVTQLLSAGLRPQKLRPVCASRSPTFGVKPLIIRLITQDNMKVNQMINTPICFPH